MAKEFFKENNVEYTEKDVAVDIDARQEMMEKTDGNMGVPVIQIDDGKPIIGFDEDSLKKALEL